MELNQYCHTTIPRLFLFSEESEYTEYAFNLFSKDLKQFLTLGLQLFHSKCIRVMGGLNSIGHFAQKSREQDKILHLERQKLITPRPKGIETRKEITEDRLWQTWNH